MQEAKYKTQYARGERQEGKCKKEQAGGEMKEENAGGKMEEG